MRPTVGKHDVIHKTGSTWHRAVWIGYYMTPLTRSSTHERCAVLKQGNGTSHTSPSAPPSRHIVWSWSLLSSRSGLNQYYAAGVLARAQHSSDAAAVAPHPHAADCRKNATSSTKPEVHFILQLRHRRWIHCYSRQHAQKMWWFKLWARGSWDMRVDKQTDR